MSNKAKKTNIVNIRVTSEEKLNWELFAHAEGLKTSQLARWANTYKDAASATQVIGSLTRIESALLELEGRGVD